MEEAAFVMSEVSRYGGKIVIMKKTIIITSNYCFSSVIVLYFGSRPCLVRTFWQSSQKYQKDSGNLMQPAVPPQP